MLNQFNTKQEKLSDVGEAWICNPSVSSQALYHWATVLIEKYGDWRVKRYMYNAKCISWADGISHLLVLLYQTAKRNMILFLLT